VATIRVLFVCHASTAATRRTAFPVDEPLEPIGLAAAEQAAGHFPDWPSLSGPMLRCRQTAEALGLSAIVDDDLSDWDLGRWAGRSMNDLAAEAPADLQAWTSDPGFRRHGGESLTELIARAGRWLDAPPASRPDRFVAVVPAAWIRAALVTALGAPASGFWRVDVPPLSSLELRGNPGRWSFHAHP
jgi:broad specificity phosphatase PhoE